LEHRAQLSDFGIETSLGVFHARSWSTKLPLNFVHLLLRNLESSDISKLRFCVHPNPDEIMQITYLAFKAPYKDRIHKHPNRPEVILPLSGEAIHSSYDSRGLKLSQSLLAGNDPSSLSTEVGVWHSLEIITPFFVMLEIGSGPFRQDSTVFLGDEN
jgi:cupin fold WbuC family metalloprotein